LCYRFCDTDRQKGAGPGRAGCGDADNESGCAAMAVWGQSGEFCCNDGLCQRGAMGDCTDGSIFRGGASVLSETISHLDCALRQFWGVVCGGHYSSMAA